MTGSYRRSDGEASSDSSELTRGESVMAEEEEETTSSMDSSRRESRSTEWTDEKHSMYLKSMEASFVDQLYSSLGFLGGCSQNENMADVKSPVQKYRSNGMRSGQFKVLRGGCWQRMAFRRHESQVNRRDKSHQFLASPWIKHFRPVVKAQDLTSLSFEGSSASGSQAIGSIGKKGNPTQLGCGSVTSPKMDQIGQTHLREQHLISCREEVSDQNFVDEEAKGDKASCESSSKKMKFVTNESSSNDQVVPLRKTPAT